MNPEYRYYNNAVVVELIHEDGSLKDPDIHELCSAISRLLSDENDKVAMDISSCTYLNSYGLGELISIRNYFNDIHADCLLITENDKVLKLLDMVGFNDLFHIVPDEQEIPSRV